MQAGLPARLEVEFLELTDGVLEPYESEWRDLERRNEFASPYLSFDWLSAWASVYRAPCLKLFRLLDEDGAVQALGLIEARSLGRLSFAGEPISPQRGLLCAAGFEDSAWLALAQHLDTCSYRWVTLDAEGAPSAAAVLPRARVTAVPFLSVELPRTFEEYLDGAPGRKQWVSRNLRLLERADGRVQRASNVPGALEEFVRLHQERALAKHERHPQVDMLLAATLERLANADSIELFLLELIVREKTLGVAVHLRYGDCMYTYNFGIATSEPGLSPGVLLEIAGIRDALACELKRFDFGPGQYKYKIKIGGTASDRFELVASSKSFRATLVAGSLVSFRKGRSLFGRNRLRQLADRVSHSR